MNTTVYSKLPIKYFLSTSVEDNFDYESFRQHVKDNLHWDYLFAISYLVISVAFVSLKLPKYNTTVAYTTWAAISVLLTLPMAVRTLQVVISVSWSRSFHSTFCDATVDNFQGFWIASYKYYFYFHNIDLFIRKLGGYSISVFVIHHNAVYLLVPYIVVSNFPYFRFVMALSSCTIASMSSLHFLRGVNLITADTSYVNFVRLARAEDLCFVLSGLYVSVASLTDNCDLDINILYLAAVFLVTYKYQDIWRLFRHFTRDDEKQQMYKTVNTSDI
ncbi:hypothetical protein HDE_12215 [Halotydeus destructor]|nr:hypothetical protein HDE_12215 [Halotydeus destructor]